MPLGALAESLLSVVAEFIGEVLVKGVGYVLVKHIWYLGRKNPDPDGAACVLVGIAFWLAIGWAGVAIYRRVQATP